MEEETAATTEEEVLAIVPPTAEAVVAAAGATAETTATATPTATAAAAANDDDDDDDDDHGQSEPPSSTTATTTTAPEVTAVAETSTATKQIGDDGIAVVNLETATACDVVPVVEALEASPHHHHDHHHAATSPTPHHGEHGHRANADARGRRRPELVSATVSKPSCTTAEAVVSCDGGGGDTTTNAFLGITVRVDVESGDLIIASLKPGGRLFDSPLRPGDVLVSINGKSCVGMDGKTAAGIMGQITGTCTIVARCPDTTGSQLFNVNEQRVVETMVEKSCAPKIGLGLRRAANGQYLEVSRVHAGGIFAHSPLINVGDVIVSINGVECHDNDTTARDAVQIIRQCTDNKITIRTAPQGSTGVVLACANCSSERPEDDRHHVMMATATADTSMHGSHNHNPSVLNFDADEWAANHKHQACFCIWMIVGSLLIVGVAIFTLN